MIDVDAVEESLSERLTTARPRAIVIQGQLDAQAVAAGLARLGAGAPLAQTPKEIALLFLRWFTFFFSIPGWLEKFECTLTYRALLAIDAGRTPAIRDRPLLHAASSRHLLEAVAVFARHDRSFNMALVAAEKERGGAGPAARGKHLNGLAAQVLEELTVGQLDLTALLPVGRAGHICKAEKREFTAPPEDLKQVSDAVAKLGGESDSFVNEYRFLCELLHPATASYISMFDEQLHSLSADIQVKEEVYRPDPRPEWGASRFTPFLDGLLPRLLAHVLSCLQNSEKVRERVVLLARRFRASMLNFHGDPVRGYVLRHLDQHPYDECLCLSGKKYKFCCRDEFRCS